MITIRRNVTKQCPYKAEIDIGELVITLPGDAPELHGLARLVEAVAETQISHEDYTRAILAILPEGASVLTRWRTGPWSVEVREGSDLLREPVNPAGA